MGGKLYSNHSKDEGRRFFKKIVNSNVKFIGKVSEDRIQEKLLYLDVRAFQRVCICVEGVWEINQIKWTRYEMKGIDTDSCLKKFAGNRMEDREKTEVFDWFLCRCSTIKWLTCPQFSNYTPVQFHVYLLHSIPSYIPLSMASQQVVADDLLE